MQAPPDWHRCACGAVYDAALSYSGYPPADHRPARGLYCSPACSTRFIAATRAAVGVDGWPFKGAAA